MDVTNLNCYYKKSDTGSSCDYCNSRIFHIIYLLYLCFFIVCLEMLVIIVINQYVWNVMVVGCTSGYELEGKSSSMMQIRVKRMEVCVRLM